MKTLVAFAALRKHLNARLFRRPKGYYVIKTFRSYLNLIMSHSAPKRRWTLCVFDTDSNRNTLPRSSCVELHIAVSFAPPFITLRTGSDAVGCATSL